MTKAFSRKNSLLKVFALVVSVVMLLSFTAMNASAYELLTGKGIKTPPLTFYGLSGTPSLYTSSIQRCMSTWNSAGYGTMFRYGGQSSSTIPIRGDRVSHIFTTSAGKTGVYAVTNTAYETNTGYIVEADISFNTSYDFSSVVTDGIYIDSVSTHELGHALGLDDTYSSAYSESTMYGYYSRGETKKQTLHQDDLNGLEALYG